MKVAVVVLILAVFGACSPAREILVKKNEGGRSVVVHRTKLGPALVPGGVLFRVNPRPGTFSLTVAGTFNQWDPTVSILTNNPVLRVWEGFVKMPHKGKIRFKYIRNGREWVTDPFTDTDSDGYGSKNSVFNLEKAKN